MVEDQEQKVYISARHGLEDYCLNLKHTIDEPIYKDKISEEGRIVIRDKVDEILLWLDGNSKAEKEEFEQKRKTLESVCKPIIAGSSSNTSCVIS